MKATTASLTNENTGWTKSTLVPQYIIKIRNVLEAPFMNSNFDSLTSYLITLLHTMQHLKNKIQPLEDAYNLYIKFLERIKNVSAFFMPKCYWQN